MKTITELRTTLNFNPQEINSQVKFFAENVKIDFDVFLPSKGINLQRDLVWNIDQKREIIWSILMGRNIPRMAMINVVTKGDTDGVYQVIDGKQRLTSMLDFYINKFTLLIDDKEYFFKDLPIDYQRVIKGFHFAYYIVNEDYGIPITDQEKIDWFMYINFAGTPQEQAHFNKLNN